MYPKAALGVNTATVTNLSIPKTCFETCLLMKLASLRAASVMDSSGVDMLDLIQRRKSVRALNV